MGNDRDDKFEGHEESEYHFSDEEVSYEVEPETPKQPTSTGGGGEAKESLLTRITRSKRMLISLVVFLVLVFVVYKMVVPSSSVPSTNIATPPVVAQQAAAPNVPATTQMAAPAAPTAGAVSTVPSVPGAMATPQPTAGTTATASAATTQAAAVQQPAAGPALPTQATATAVIPPSGGAVLTGTQAMVMQPGAVQQPSAVAQPVSAITQPQQVATLPTVIPVQSPVSTYNANQPTGATTVTSAVAALPANAPLEAKTAALSADAENLMNQQQMNYIQKLNEYSSQNKLLQDQVQTLNARVANMENQLNQLVQVLSRQQGVTSNVIAPTPVEVVEQPKVAFNVQAIIPGRAWLKSDNGETLTVAEGDVIKGLGRVTKIDPYDGLVEINTGSKAISLSYGNGG